MKPMLENQTLQAIIQAAIDAGLDAPDVRTLLFARMKTVKSGMPKGTDNQLQLRLDLATLNETYVRVHDSYPLAIWLENALPLIAGRPELALFQSAQQGLQAPVAAEPPLAGSRSVSERADTSPEDKQATSAVVPVFPAAPVFFADERVVKIFVGRSLDLERVLSTIRRQKLGQKSRPKPGLSLFWYHGFGGMGKSWLLRRLAYLASKPRRQKQAGPGVMLVDWNPNDRWSPLGTRASVPEVMFRGIAIRATQVYGSELLQPFWDALHRFELRVSDWTDLRMIRLGNALSDLITEADASREEITTVEGDRLPVRLSSDQANRDRDILKAVLQEKDLWPSEPNGLANSLELIKRRGPIQDEVYTAWAERVVSPTLVDRQLVVRPLDHLAEVLRDCLRIAASVRPLLLLLDTCEALDEWTEHWLRRLLVPLLASVTPIMAVVGTRSRPDRYHRPGERGGWSDEMAGRLDPVPFDKGRYFPVTEIEQLLKLANASVPGIDRSTLADRLHRITRGIPFALGLLMDRQHSDLLAEVAESDEIANQELNAPRAMRTINEELAARYLLHVKSDKDRADIQTLALIPGIEEDPGDEPRWSFQDRLFSARGPMHFSETERMRDRVLAILWTGAAWQTRLIELERTYGLVADGDLHPVIRYALRSRWRDTPPDGMNGLLDRLIGALDAFQPRAGVFDQAWVTWHAWRIGFESWKAGVDVSDSLERAVVVANAHALNVLELEKLLYELRRGSPVFRTMSDPDFREPEVVSRLTTWTPFEQACFELVRGLAIAEGMSVAKGADRYVEAAEFLGRAVELLWPTLPDTQKKRVSETYLRVVSKGTFDDHHPDILERALELSQKLPLDPGGVWWGYILHNKRRYEESCTALRAVLETDPTNDDAHVALVHNLAHHLSRPDDALTATDQWLANEPDNPLRIWCLRGSILADLGRLDQGISELSDVLKSTSSSSFLNWSVSFRAECHFELGKLYALAERLDEAEVELRTAFEMDPAPTTSFTLADLLDKRGKTAESIGIYDSVLKDCSQGSKDWCDVANRVAWRRYLHHNDLDTAERLAKESLDGSNSLTTLQTLFAVQARAGKWEAADPHFRRYLREGSVVDVVGRQWREDILFFRDAIRADKQHWVSERIKAELTSPRDDRWEVIRLALTDEAVKPNRLESAVRVVAAQFRSPDPNPSFPPIASHVL